MASLTEMVKFTNDYLEISKFEDYCPNGLQVEGSCDVKRILMGVTASQALINGAVEKEVELIMVHHGFFWRGEAPEIVGLKQKKIAMLLKNNISLLGYHLPLDAHPICGNNVQLANKLGLKAKEVFGKGKTPLVLSCELDKTIPAVLFVEQLERVLGRKSMHIGADENKMVKTVGICTGGAQNYFSDVIDYGLDIYITGEASEQNYHMAIESGVDFVSAGHHATERYGIQALGEIISKKFRLESEYFEIENPI